MHAAVGQEALVFRFVIVIRRVLSSVVMRSPSRGSSLIWRGMVGVVDGAVPSDWSHFSLVTCC